jgi:hypothetical protein
VSSGSNVAIGSVWQVAVWHSGSVANGSAASGSVAQWLRGQCQHRQCQHRQCQQQPVTATSGSVNSGSGSVTVAVWPVAVSQWQCHSVTKWQCGSYLAHGSTWPPHSAARACRAASVEPGVALAGGRWQCGSGSGRWQVAVGSGRCQWMGGSGSGWQWQCVGVSVQEGRWAGLEIASFYLFFIAAIFNTPPHYQYPLPHHDSTTIRTAPISSFHCHPNHCHTYSCASAANPRPNTVRFFLKKFPCFSDCHSTPPHTTNTHCHTMNLPSFAPPCSPLSNATPTTANRPLPLTPQPLPRTPVQTPSGFF